MKNKRNLILSLILTVVTAIYTFLVKNVDVAAIGPRNSSVGFSKLNYWFMKLIDYNMAIYKFTEIVGLIVLLIVVIYAIIGLLQLIKRKSIFKVDREIISLGILFVLMFVMYVFFEKFIINYRPVLIDNELEASFPSSHTVLAICTCISSLIVSKKYVPKKYLNMSTAITILLLIFVFAGRTISGVHWLSDIIGGVIISTTLLMYFYTILKYKSKD